MIQNKCLSYSRDVATQNSKFLSQKQHILKKKHMELDAKSLEQDIYQEIQKVIVKANTVWMRRLNPLRWNPDEEQQALKRDHLK